MWCTGAAASLCACTSPTRARPASQVHGNDQVLVELLPQFAWNLPPITSSRQGVYTPQRACSTGAGVSCQAQHAWWCCCWGPSADGCIAAAAAPACSGTEGSTDSGSSSRGQHPQRCQRRTAKGSSSGSPCVSHCQCCCVSCRGGCRPLHRGSTPPSANQCRRERLVEHGVRGVCWSCRQVFCCSSGSEQ